MTSRNFYHKLSLINLIFDNEMQDLRSKVHTNLIRAYYDHIIDINNESMLRNLLKYIETSTSFHHIEFNGKPYYEKSNCHEQCVPKSRPKYDINTECTDYNPDTDRCGASIFPTIGDRLKYILKYHGECDSFEDDNAEINNFINIIASCRFEKILLVGYKSLTISNPNGINYDHRGSNHCNVYLKFYDKVSTKKWISFSTLAKYFYKLKSHKWDRWYELYCGMDFKSKNGNIRVEMNFDHGS